MLETIEKFGFTWLNGRFPVRPRAAALRERGTALLAARLCGKQVG